MGARMGCGLLIVVERQPVQHGRIGIKHQHANVGERSQVQHFHEGLRHALGPVLLPQLFVGDALDMLQVRIRPGRGDQLPRVRQLCSQVLVFARAHFQKCHYNSANCSGAAGFSIPNA